MKRPNLWNSGKYFIAALAIFLVVYLIYDSPEEEKMKTSLSEHEEIFTPPQEQTTTLRDSIVAYSIDLLGTPYVTAGSGKDGFDCSGFVYFVYQNFNIDVPRSTSGYENFGREIPIADVQKADLLLFLSPTRNAVGHIGIVTEEKGTESNFIHATSGREMKVIVTSLSNEGYTKRFVKAIRVL